MSPSTYLSILALTFLPAELQGQEQSAVIGEMRDALIDNFIRFMQGDMLMDLPEPAPVPERSMLDRELVNIYWRHLLNIGQRLGTQS